MGRQHHVLLFAMIAIFALYAHPATAAAQSGNPDSPIITRAIANPANVKAKQERLYQLEAVSLTAEQLRQKELPEPMRYGC